MHARKGERGTQISNRIGGKSSCMGSLPTRIYDQMNIFITANCNYDTVNRFQLHKRLDRSRLLSSCFNDWLSKKELMAACAALPSLLFSAYVVNCMISSHIYESHWFRSLYITSYYFYNQSRYWSARYDEDEFRGCTTKNSTKWKWRIIKSFSKTVRKKLGNNLHTGFAISLPLPSSCVANAWREHDVEESPRIWKAEKEQLFLPVKFLSKNSIHRKASSTSNEPCSKLLSPKILPFCSKTLRP
jgi:hypothetical protein